MSLADYPNITAFMARMDAREAVQQALAAEELEAFSA
jgi:glutathione S-transferase